MICTLLTLAALLIGALGPVALFELIRRLP